MNVVGSNVPSDNLDVVCLTNLPYQISNSQRHVTPQNRLPVLRAEHQVVLQEINGMRSSTVRGHPTTVPQASSRRRLKAGVSTLPENGQ